jgi:molecular chaperone HscB
LFHCEPGFDLDLHELANQYRALQKTAHPDRFVTGTDQEKRFSAQMTSRINEGYDTLKHPLKRAIYLLDRSGVEIEHNPTLEPMFLMEQIELREELEDIGEAGEDGLPRLDQFRSKGKTVLEALQAEFVQAYPVSLPNAEHAVYKMQFIHKLLSEAKQLEERILDY